MGVRTANVQDGNIGQTMEGLAATIHGRREASPEASYITGEYLVVDGGNSRIENKGA